MTTNLNGLALDVAAAAPLPRGAAPVISAAGVNDVAAIARQQLPGAVPAPALIAAYAANIASPPKPIIRTATTTPSSALAAQMIAQTPGISEADLAIFTPQQPTPPPVAEEEAPNDFLNALRMARGDLHAPATKEIQQAKPAPQATTMDATRETVAIAAARSGAAESATHMLSTQLTFGFPTVLSQWFKRPNLIQARGVGAYQLAEARNTGSRKVATAPKRLPELAIQ